MSLYRHLCIDVNEVRLAHRRHLSEFAEYLGQKMINGTNLVSVETKTSGFAVELQFFATPPINLLPCLTTRKDLFLETWFSSFVLNP